MKETGLEVFWNPHHCVSIHWQMHQSEVSFDGNQEWQGSDTRQGWCRWCPKQQPQELVSLLR